MHCLLIQCIYILVIFYFKADILYDMQFIWLDAEEEESNL